MERAEAGLAQSSADQPAASVPQPGGEGGQPSGAGGPKPSKLRNHDLIETPEYSPSADEVAAVYAYRC